MVLSAAVAVWTVQGDQTTRIRSHLVVYAVAFASYLVALRASAGLSARGLRRTLLVALAWRLALVAAPPLLSDDVYRYVWEGRIQLHGGNPYAWSDRPEVEKWAPMRDEVFRRVTHKDYTAVYPPLWQMAARGVAAVHDSVLAFKLFEVLCEALTLGVLARLLQARGQPRERLLVMAWSPLALVEIAGSGHNEAFGMLFLAFALAAVERGRTLAGAVAAGLGSMAKLLPGVVALAWLRRFRWRDLLVAVAASVWLVVPYVGAGRGLWRSLGKYGEFWRFNETAFAALSFLAGSHTGGVGLALILLVAAALTLAWRRTAPVPAALAVVAASILLAPNVLPWYALWLLPLLVARDEPALLLFTGTVGLAYLVYPAWLSGHPWHVGWGTRALEYGPCLAVFAWTRARQWTR